MSKRGGKKVADTDLNKVIKMDYVPVKISYTSKDYASILEDLINSVSGITQKWQVLDDNDPRSYYDKTYVNNRRYVILYTGQASS